MHIATSYSKSSLFNFVSFAIKQCNLAASALVSMHKDADTAQFVIASDAASLTAGGLLRSTRSAYHNKVVSLAKQADGNYLLQINKY
jgi:general stress protein CsbA